MGLPVSITFGGLAAASANNIAHTQTPTSGTALTLNGSTVTGGVATLDFGRSILLTFGSEAANRTMVFTGTAPGGNPIQETVTVVSGSSGTVATVQNFLTVTSALPLGGGWTAAVTVGTNTVASTPWTFTNSQEWAPATVNFNVTISGTVTWSIECTNTALNSNMNAIGGGPLGNYAPVPNVYVPVSGLSSQSTGGNGAITVPFVAWRAKILSGTGTIVVEAVEGGMH